MEKATVFIPIYNFQMMSYLKLKLFPDKELVTFHRWNIHDKFNKFSSSTQLQWI
jgi:hypothetical protein